MSKKGDKKNILKYIIILAVIILGIYLIYNSLSKPEILPGPGGVSRSFDKTSAYVGDEITVTLNVDIIGTDTAYSIEEVVDADATITSPGTGVQTGNVLRWLEYGSPPVSGPYIYKVKFEGAGVVGIQTWSGTYAFNDDVSTTIIIGDNTVTITGCQYEEDYNPCDDCVTAGEIAAYVSCWVNADLSSCVPITGITQIEATNAADRWVNGISTVNCP